MLSSGITRPAGADAGFGPGDPAPRSFGSRATGLARPDSDYDLLVILPDDIDPYVRALIMSNVRDMVRETGAAVDHEYVTVNTWQNPPPGARILVERAKSQGIEVPDD
ncbi:MAG TPA: nucleotidyltransferase domain-containing protein [Streptosporangiaceae bacterium]|nr:nucleotidyltransferase domain-containing protein [Streptosporangiaceae bacterium]